MDIQKAKCSKGLVHRVRQGLGIAAFVVGVLIAALPGGALARTSAVAPTTTSLYSAETDTTTTIYQIASLGNLIWVGEDVENSSGRYYQLTRNINAAETASWNDADTNKKVKEGFYPIGLTSGSFQGIFDGNKKTISGLTIHRPGTDKLGLFSHTSSGAVIKNLSVTGKVTGSSQVGSLIGYAENTTVTQCLASCPVTALDVKGGGLIGESSGCLIASCGTAGKVTASSYVGGLIGSSIQDAINNCATTGAVAGYESYVGGLIGNAYGLDIVGCTTRGAVKSVMGTAVGGLLGGNSSYGPVSGSILGCAATGSVTGLGSVGGLVGESYGESDDNPTAISHCVASGVVKSVYTGAECTGGLLGYLEYGVVSNSTASGKVSSVGWEAGGLIGEAKVTTVTECVASGFVQGYGEVGGLLGYSHDVSLTGCFASGRVLGGEDVGGLAGVISLGLVDDCHASGSVTGDTQYAGGFAGKIKNNSIVSGCYATGKVTSVNYVGGLAGYSTVSNMTACWATGMVKGDYMAGGLVGECNDGSISECSAGGATMGYVRVGGLIGSGKGVDIDQCYALGRVAGIYYVGGLAGWYYGRADSLPSPDGLDGNGYTSVSNSYARGAVAGDYCVGGLLGYVDGIHLSNSYSTGKVSADADYAGGLVGFAVNEYVDYCYWDMNTSGLTVSAAGDGFSTTELKAGVPSGWVSSGAWGISAAINNGYPYLLAFFV